MAPGTTEAPAEGTSAVTPMTHCEPLNSQYGLGPYIQSNGLEHGVREAFRRNETDFRNGYMDYTRQADLPAGPYAPIFLGQACLPAFCRWLSLAWRTCWLPLRAKTSSQNLS